ncbi:hypothetical protein [Kitasatospora sp. NPDC093102]|uniref:hypothetical protein n=1 Tax=Kitasatospora sp. NPDC093102 TaxID=3155069 RepID=UPI003435CC13
MHISIAGYRQGMGLDDAISKARRQHDLREAQQTQEKDQRQREQERLRNLLAEAVERLRPYRGETFHRMRVSATGPLRGPDGARYQQVSAHWCWLIKELNGESLSRQRSVMLLVLDASAARVVRVHLTLQGGAGQYVTSMAPEPVGPQDYQDKGIMAWLGGGWINELESDLGAAIVRYERSR